MQKSPAFTVAINADGKDQFDFDVRRALASKRKHDLGIPANRPLPAPWMLAIEPMMACNARCNFCAFSEQRTRMRLHATDQLRSGLPRDVVVEILESARTHGTKGTYWSGGGEPTLWAHFDEAITQCASFSDVFVQTNGTKLDRFSATVEKLARFRIISVSVVGDSVSLNDKIGMGSFARISKILPTSWH